MKQFYIYLKYLLIVITIAFAGYNYYNKIVNPFSSDILKCEGIILDEEVSIHLTNKNSIESLRKIRENFIPIENEDILLHYRDRDMEKITPSYWGSVFFNKTTSKWSFKLDKSFTNNPQNPSNIHLPFLRRLSDDNFFYKGGSILSEKELSKKHFINNVGGSKASRFYLQIQKKGDKKILPFFDEGIKKKYSLRSKGDTVLVSFNKRLDNARKYLYTYKFNNSSNHENYYEIIYTKRNTIVKNLSNNKITIVKDKYFPIGNMLFSLSPRYNFLDILLLTIFLLIIISSIGYIVYKKTAKNTIELAVDNFRISILFFYAIGFPVLATAFDTQNFSPIRKIIITVFIPLVPIFPIFISCFLKGNSFMNNNIFFNKIIIATNKSRRFFNIKFDNLIKNKLGIVFLLIVGFSLLFTSKNERVLGLIPTLHYVKLILFIVFFLLYTNIFTLYFENLKKLFGEKYKTYIKSVLIIVFAILTSVITQDYGSLILIFFTCCLYEYSLGNLPFKLGKIKISLFRIVIGYILISLFTFLLGYFIELPDKLYRLTYTWLNPDSIFYSSVKIADRESIGIIYQSLKLLEKYPLGIQNIIIPREALSVSHTDYALVWATVNNGIIFISILLICILFFIRNCFKLIFLLLNKKNNGLSVVSATIESKAFTSFTLIFLVMQCLVPVMSNLMLPSAFLTGIPFPGISISIGDGLFLFLLFYLLQELISKNNLIKENDFQDFDIESHKFSNKITLNIMKMVLVLILLKVAFLIIQPSETKFHFQNKLVDSIKDIPKEKRALLIYSSKYFSDVKSITNLSNNEKLIANMISCNYFTNGNKKLSPLKTNFKTNSKILCNRIIADSSLNFKKQILSKNNNKIVHKIKHFVNGIEKISVSDKYYSNLNFRNANLDLESSAMLNRKIENFLKQKKLKNYYKNLKVSFLISENKSGVNYVEAAYPLIKDDFISEFNFFPGSVKKIILAHYFSYNGNDINENIFKSNKSKNAINWIKYSDNNATIEYWNSIDLKKFQEFLMENYPRFPYTSNSLINGYNNNNKKAKTNSIIGGMIKYTPQQINRWMQTCSNEAFRDNRNLFTLLNSPFTGTARKVKYALAKNGYDTNKFICKTGTLEEKRKNISTAFIISNKRFTISILIDGLQPENRLNVSAKDLFITAMPFLNKYLK